MRIKRTAQVVRAMALLVAAVGLAGSVLAQPATIDSLLRATLGHEPVGDHIIFTAFSIKVESSMQPMRPGVIPLRIKLNANVICDEMTVTVAKTDHLEYSGPNTWTFPADPEDTVEFSVSVTVPPNDTSSFLFEVSCGPWTDFGGGYFVSTDTNCWFSGADPRSGVGVLKGRSTSKSIGTPSEVIYEQMHSAAHSMRGYYDDDGNLVESDSARPRPKQSSRDSGLMWVRTSSGEKVLMNEEQVREFKKQYDLERDLARKRELEETPLTDADRQAIKVGDETWLRYKGEYRFRKAEPIYDVYAHTQRLLDSARAVQPDAAYHITLDLRDPDDYAAVALLVDSLIPMDSAGYYRATVLGRTLKEIGKKGVRYQAYPHYPREPRTGPSRNAQPRKKKKAKPEFLLDAERFETS